MKAIINKMLAGVAVAAALGLGSCVNDLDLMPIDPTQQTVDKFTDDPREFVGGLMAKCYSSLAVSGQGGAGSADIGGLDAGTSQYLRAVFMMQEFPTDECLWIWQDEGVYDVVTNNYSAANANIYGAYSRFMVHIQICNEFLRTMGRLGDYGISVDAELQKDIDQFKLEARTLRDLSYFYLIDCFGQCSWSWDDIDFGVSPQQITREECFNRVVADLEDVVANWPENQSVIYGRIGKEAAQALLCKYYLNAEVYTGKAQWQKCWDMAKQIIAKHDTNANHGLAKCYQALFCGNNGMFVIGDGCEDGSVPGQKEILWAVPQQFQLTESYGATTFMIAAAVTGYEGDPANGYTQSKNYGLNAQWACMHARQQFSELFGFQDGLSDDLRTLMWATDVMGHKIDNENFSSFTDGYIPMKYNNLRANPDGSFPYAVYDLVAGKYATDYDGNFINDYTTLPEHYMNRFGDQTLNQSWYTTTNAFADTDFPVIRLAEVYLMAAEAYANGAGNGDEALKYANYVRTRAGLPEWTTPGNLTKQNVLDERARELYWENNRRTDLIRNGKFTGSSYVWSWKGGVQAGTATPANQNLFPIPSQVLAAQPSFNQNPGY